MATRTQRKRADDVAKVVTPSGPRLYAVHYEGAEDYTIPGVPGQRFTLDELKERAGEGDLVIIRVIHDRKPGWDEQHGNSNAA